MLIAHWSNWIMNKYHIFIAESYVANGQCFIFELRTIHKIPVWLNGPPSQQESQVCIYECALSMWIDVGDSLWSHANRTPVSCVVSLAIQDGDSHWNFTCMKMWKEQSIDCTGFVCNGYRIQNTDAILFQWLT